MALLTYMVLRRPVCPLDLVFSFGSSRLGGRLSHILWCVFCRSRTYRDQAEAAYIQSTARTSYSMHQGYALVRIIHIPIAYRKPTHTSTTSLRDILNGTVRAQRRDFQRAY